MMFQQMADAQLVKLSASGDSLAFEEIVKRNVSSVSAVAYALTGDRDVSEDITQEVFLAGWKRLNDLREPAKLRAWLCSIAQNMANSVGRKSARDPIKASGDLELSYQVASGLPSPAEAAISAEQQRLLWSTIERIPEAYRLPLILFYREEQSIAQVGSALDLTDDAVRQRLSRARKMLKEEVAKTVEIAMAKSRPGPLLVKVIMGGIVSTALQATAISAATAASAKIAGGTAASSTGISAAILALVLAPMHILGGVFRAHSKYREGQSAEERRLILQHQITGPSVIMLWALAHVSLIKASSQHLLSDAHCYIAMLCEVALLIVTLWLLHRLYKKNYYCILKSNEGNLNVPQARHLSLLEASHEDREIGTHLDTIQKIYRRPFTTAYAVHGGQVLAGLAWVAVDGASRNDMNLLLASLLAATVVEFTAVACTMHRPRHFLLHRSLMLFSVLPLMGFTVAYWKIGGVLNPLQTRPEDSWFVLQLLPIIVAVGYVLPALYFLIKHRRLSALQVRV